MPRSPVIVAPMALLLAAGLSAPAAAQSPDPTAAAGGATQVVTGLDSPRGIAIGADGTLYVAEVGTGGDARTASPTRKAAIRASATLAASAPWWMAPRPAWSTASSPRSSDTGETLGVSDIAVGADGTVWLLVGGPGPGAAEARAAVTGGEGIGQLYTVGADGSLTSVADFVQYESEVNPDADQPENGYPIRTRTASP